VAALVAGGYPYDYEGDAYRTVSGQNANNSVRISDEFMETLKKDGDWNLRWRTDARISKTVKARDLWKQICDAAWKSADPGIQ
jgi:ribonucleoside-diphosphate reductase alpha chain